MRALVPLLLVALSSLASCSPETKHVAPTQTVVRVEADALVQAELTSLRVRTSAPGEGGWTQRNDARFPADALRWPVDIVVVPRSEAEAGGQFEVIAEALDADDVPLVQARALTGFVRREQRVLVLTLAACGDRSLGFLCEPDSACLGPQCSTCLDASCAATPFSAPADLPAFSPWTELDGGEPVAAGEAGADSGADMETGPATEGGADDAGVPDTGEPDAMGIDDAGSDGATPIPRPCDPGSERSDGGECVDIDECAQGLDDCDDAPDACVNLSGGLGFSCACPAGYRGEGRGASGCVDIDECAEQTDNCDPLAACNNAPGSYSCGDCPPGYTQGASGACQDIDECATNNGGCDTSPMARCLNRVGAPNTCECPAGYSGNGVGSAGCTDVNECLSNNGGCDTSPMATCNNVTGAPRTCTCPSGYSGNGVGANGCQDIPDCTPSSCQHSGRCIDGVNSFTCDCGGTGYSGDRCQVDPCSPNPCGTGLSCTRTPQATASCSANCASGGGCQPGDACVTDADCRTGGDSSATCDATDRVCVRVCGETTISSQANLTAARYCREITGDLILDPTFATIAASSLPYLARIRGSIRSGSPTGNSGARTITFGRLETVDGSVGFGGYLNLTSVSFPRLATVGGAFEFILSSALNEISAPQLTRVQGALTLGYLDSLSQVDLGRLNSVGAHLRLLAVCRLPWSQVQRISTFGSGRTIEYVGCCIQFSQHTTCTMGTPPCSCGS